MSNNVLNLSINSAVNVAAVDKEPKLINVVMPAETDLLKICVAYLTFIR